MAGSGTTSVGRASPRAGSSVASPHRKPRTVLWWEVELLALQAVAPRAGAQRFDQLHAGRCSFGPLLRGPSSRSARTATTQTKRRVRRRPQSNRRRKNFEVLVTSTFTVCWLL